MSKFILLDRDGVINYDSDDYIKSPDEFNIIPSSLTALKMLYQHNYKIIVITNQSGINRNLYTNETLEIIHQKLHSSLNEMGVFIEKVYICPHTPDENCNCRKPKPLLITQAIREYNIPTKGLFFIGDKLSDIEAAQNANIQSALVLTGKGQRTIEKHKDKLPKSLPIFDNLLAAAEHIINHQM